MFAPYVPLRGTKVCSQLKKVEHEELLRELVERLGGSMVTAREGLDESDYIVANDGDDYGDFALSPLVVKYINENTSRYDKVRFMSTMFDNLTEALIKTVPMVDGDMLPTFKFRGVLYPIRTTEYSPLGDTFFYDLSWLTADEEESKVLKRSPEIEVLIIKTSTETECSDPWDTDLVRYQLVASKNEKKYCLLRFHHTLHEACHQTDCGLLVTVFNSREDAVTEFNERLNLHLKVSIADVKRKMKVEDEDMKEVCEVLYVRGASGEDDEFTASDETSSESESSADETSERDADNKEDVADTAAANS